MTYLVFAIINEILFHCQYYCLYVVCIIIIVWFFKSNSLFAYTKKKGRRSKSAIIFTHCYLSEHIILWLIKWNTSLAWRGFFISSVCLFHAYTHAHVTGRISVILVSVHAHDVIFFHLQTFFIERRCNWLAANISDWLKHQAF